MVLTSPVLRGFHQGSGVCRAAETITRFVLADREKYTFGYVSDGCDVLLGTVTLLHLAQESMGAASFTGVTLASYAENGSAAFLDTACILITIPDICANPPLQTGCRMIRHPVGCSFGAGFFICGCGSGGIRWA